MRFDVDQRFRSTPDDVAAAYADPALYTALPATEKLARPEVVSHTVEGTRVVLEVRYRFHGELSSAVRAVLDPARLTWVQRSVHDLGDRTSSFELRPDHYPDRLSGQGRLRVDRDGPTGSRRHGHCELKVRALLVAGTVERTLVGDLRRHLAAEAAAVERYLGGC
jgi:hypothetical protein